MDLDPYEGFSKTVSSLVICAHPGCDRVKSKSKPNKGEGCVVPEHQGCGTDSKLEKGEVSCRPKEPRIRLLGKSRSLAKLDTFQHDREWFPLLGSLKPVTAVVARGTQTVAVSIYRFPVESRSLPVPWSRRLRTVSRASQTERNAGKLVDKTPTWPGWDLLPQEVFIIEDITTEKSLNTLMETFLVNTLKNISVQEPTPRETPSRTPLIPRCTPGYKRPKTKWPSTLPRRDDQEVFIQSSSGKTRAVGTNTAHVGWPHPRPRNLRLRLSRDLSYGWRSNPDTANAATQTEY
nr:uncharacterized protein LOC123744903 [Procambarus clarkii]